MNKRGQASTEMVFLLPILVAIVGAAMFFAYVCWQGIRVQQAANFAARIEGQERVAGGTSTNKIDQDNGAQPGQGDPDPTDPSLNPQQKFTGRPGTVDASSVFGKYYTLIKALFPGVQNQLFIPPPVIGQNVDKVKVVRVIDLPKIPFFHWDGAQIKLEGDAYGGEDTFMYALPRWGTTGSATMLGAPSGSGPEWQQLIKDSAGNGSGG